MNYNQDTADTIETIHAFLSPLPRPSVHPEHFSSEYTILIATLISLRTKDRVTEQAASRLFTLAATPREMVRLPLERIEDAIYPAGFYKTKAANILAISRILLQQYGGRVPKDREALLSLPGVGIKTANLTLSLGYGLPYICVDTHVHRIANRLGWIRTKAPEQTETALMRVVEKKWWIPINHILVIFGQKVCRPVSPLCSSCPVSATCPREGVITHR
ncbi:MAG: endonuclease III [Spirochaetales bacterium]|nr:endonuclease III [Spirochaetales bacterium]